jgi:hypothetical protein
MLRRRVRNLDAFAGMLAMDKWTGNADSRRATFYPRTRERKYIAAFIDQGCCFGTGKWTFEDCTLQGRYWQREVYAGVTGWISFEPWLSRIEQIDERTVWVIAGEIPPKWYGNDWSALERLVEQLLKRRGANLIKGLIDAFRLSQRKPFPNWAELPKPSTCHRD